MGWLTLDLGQLGQRTLFRLDWSIVWVKHILLRALLSLSFSQPFCFSILPDRIFLWFRKGRGTVQRWSISKPNSTNISSPSYFFPKMKSLRGKISRIRSVQVSKRRGRIVEIVEIDLMKEKCIELRIFWRWTSMLNCFFLSFFFFFF